MSGSRERTVIDSAILDEIYRRLGGERNLGWNPSLEDREMHRIALGLRGGRMAIVEVPATGFLAEADRYKCP